MLVTYQDGFTCVQTVTPIQVLTTW